MEKRKTLLLPVKRIYFEQIKSGEKTEEYRSQTDYWQKRLEGRLYDEVIITLGYPKKTDTSRRLRFPYKGYDKKVINHPHFGNKAIPVYSIKLS